MISPSNPERWNQGSYIIHLQKMDIGSLRNGSEKSRLELVKHLHSAFAEASLCIAPLAESLPHLRRRTWRSITVLHHIMDNRSPKVHQLIKSSLQLQFWWFKVSVTQNSTRMLWWSWFQDLMHTLRSFLFFSRCSQNYGKLCMSKFVIDSWWNGLKF